MSQLTDNESLSIMIDESAGDLDVIPMDADLANPINNALNSQLENLGM